MDEIESEEVYISNVIDVIISCLYDKLSNINEKVDEMVEDFVDELYKESDDYIITFKYENYDVKIDYELADCYYSENNLCESPIIRIIIEDGKLSEFLTEVQQDKCKVKLHGIFYLYLWCLNFKDRDYDVRKKLLFAPKYYPINVDPIYQIKEQMNPNAEWIQITEKQYNKLRNKIKDEQLQPIV